MKINIGEVASNRGFRKEMAFGELTLKIKLSSKDDKVKEKSTASAQTDHIETQRSGLTHIFPSFFKSIFAIICLQNR